VYMIRHIQIVDGPVGGVVFPSGGGGERTQNSLKN
jgi:hypothetical protein